LQDAPDAPIGACRPIVERRRSAPSLCDKADDEEQGCRRHSSLQVGRFGHRSHP
jgi:hypothetical protein